VGILLDRKDLQNTSQTDSIQSRQAAVRVTGIERKPTLARSWRYNGKSFDIVSWPGNGDLHHYCDRILRKTRHSGKW